MVNNLSQHLEHLRYASDNERIAHAEILHTVGHSRISPVLGKSLYLIGLVRREESQPAGIQVFDHMRAAIRRSLAGEHSAGWPGYHDIDRLAIMHLLAVSRVVPIGEDERPPTPLHESIHSQRH